MTSAFDVVIVGTGHAGAQAAISLRQMGFDGSIAMVGEEAHPPYERPPLSKDVLSGERSFERILIRPESFWQDKRIDRIANARVSAVDPVRRSIGAENGRQIGFGALVWAAGGSARRLTAVPAGARNVHVVRARADVEAVMVALPGVAHVTVVGGGYIGLEAAAVLRTLGKAVTLLEAGERVLGRVTGEALSRFYEAEHRRQGVDLRVRSKIDAVAVKDGAVASVRTADGDTFRTDMVIVGIGIDPNVAPLREAGADIADGVRVDEFCRTSLPGIYAVGDCAAHANRFAGEGDIRLESVQNANDQAKTAAAHLVGQPRPYDALPWFWSNQYDLKLQTAGLSGRHDDAIVRGDPASRSFSVAYLRGERLIAIDAVNRVKDFVQAKPLILDRCAVDRTLLANPATPLAEARRA